MTETPERDRGLFSLVERLIKRPAPAVPAKPVDEDARDGLDPIVPDDKAPVSLEPQLTIESTRTLNRAELADIILRALQATDDCPPNGFEIVVYGTRPWNALLRITPAAGAVNAETWRDRLRTMVLLFREQYQVAEDDG